MTSGSEPTRRGRYLFGLPQTIVFLRDAGGNEAAQVHRLDSSSDAVKMLSDPEHAHALGPLNRAGTAIPQISVPLDRTAPGGRATIATELAWLDVATGTRRVLAHLPGTGWQATDVADDDRTILLLHYRSPSDAEIWSLDTRRGERMKLLPAAGEPAAY